MIRLCESLNKQIKASFSSLRTEVGQKECRCFSKFTFFFLIYNKCIVPEDTSSWFSVQKVESESRFADKFTGNCVFGPIYVYA